MGVENWGRHVISFAVLVVLARLLGPENFGIVALATVVLPLCTSVLEDTFAAALIRQPNLQPGHVDAAFWVLVALSLLLNLILLLAAQPLSFLFEVPEVAPIVRWLCVLVVLNGLAAVPSALLRRELRFRSLALRTLVGVSGGGLVGIAMAYADFGPWSLVGQLLVQGVLQLLVVWSAARRAPRFGFPRSCLRDIFGYGTKSVGLAVVGYIRNTLPRFVVGVVLGAVSAGLFQIATRLTWTLQMALIYPVTVVAMPTAAKVQKDAMTMSRLLVTATRYTAMITFPGFVGLAVTARELVPILVGDQWEGAVEATQLLALAGPFTSITAVNVAVMRAMNRAGWQMMVSTINVVLMLLGFLFLADRGLGFVSLVVLFSTIAVWPVQIWIFTRVTGLPAGKQHRVLLPLLAATSGMAAIVELWRMHFAGLPIQALLATEIVIGAVSYGLLILLLARPAALGLFRTVATAWR